MGAQTPFFDSKPSLSFRLDMSPSRGTGAICCLPLVHQQTFFAAVHGRDPFEYAARHGRLKLLFLLFAV
jgi:hypothetical protein